jgi:hypothetical protein
VGATHYPPLWAIALCQDPEIQKEGVSPRLISGVLQDLKSNVPHALKKTSGGIFVYGLPSDYGLQVS